MLDPWIIEEIRRREDERRRESEPQRVELPLHSPRDDDAMDTEVEREPSRRGVVVIDL